MPGSVWRVLDTPIAEASIAGVSIGLAQGFRLAILGVGRIVARAVRGADRSVALHRAPPLSLTFDHRAVIGGMAARFLRVVIADLIDARC